MEPVGQRAGGRMREKSWRVNQSSSHLNPLPVTLPPPSGLLPLPHNPHPGLKATSCKQVLGAPFRLGALQRLERPRWLPPFPPRSGLSSVSPQVRSRMRSLVRAKPACPHPWYLTELWGAPSPCVPGTPPQCFHLGTYSCRWAESAFG